MTIKINVQTKARLREELTRLEHKNSELELQVQDLANQNLVLVAQNLELNQKLKELNSGEEQPQPVPIKQPATSRKAPKKSTPTQIADDVQ